MFSKRSVGTRLAPAIVVIATVALISSAAEAGTVSYVDDDAPAAGNGQSWGTAYRFLQSALAQAGGLGGADEIRVAQGTYQPDRFESTPNGTGDRLATFEIVEGVMLMGGYAGLGAPDPDERDVELYETILSGDLSENDQPGFGNYTENSYTVVTATAGNPFTEPTLLDGFVIRAGNSNGLDLDEFSGGGMVTHVATMTIRNCTFTLNSANVDGGGIALGDGSTVENCTITDNRAFMRGGGMAVGNIFRAPTIRNCVFSGNFSDGSSGGLWFNALEGQIIGCIFLNNEADGGGSGGATVGNDVLVSHCLFLGNLARDNGAGMVFGGEGNDDALVASCLFSGNATENGDNAAISVTGPSQKRIVNCTIANNTAGGTHGGIGTLTSTSFARVTNCIVWGNLDSGGSTEDAQIGGPGTLDIDYSCVEGWTGALGGVGNTGASPLFSDAAGPDGLPGTEDDDLRLLAGSGCIDSGHNWAVPLDTTDMDDDGDTAERAPFDLDAIPRFAAVPGAGCDGAAVVDMGPYEFPGSAAPCLNPGDVNGDGTVNVIDLIGLLLEFGTSCGDTCCLTDFDFNGTVNVLDLIQLLLAFGTSCP